MRLQPDTNSGSRSERSVTPVVAIVLLVGMVILGASVIVLTGTSLIGGLQSDAEQDRAVAELGAVGHTISTQTVDGNPSEVHLSDGEYTVREDGVMSITAAGQFESGEQTVIDGLPLKALEYETDNGALAYQAGGIWRSEGETSFVQSRPNLDYRSETVGDTTFRQLEFSVIDLAGNVGHNEHEVHQADVERHTAEDLEDIRFVRETTITIEETAYADAWKQFFEDEFETDRIDENEVTLDEETNTVVLDAVVDHERPFSDFVGIEPTLYGGLHAEGSAVTHDGTALVDHYDSREGTYDDFENTSEDIYTVDADRFTVQDNANLTAVPVINGDMNVQDGAQGQPFALHEGEQIGAGSDEFFTADLSEPFDPVNRIDEQLADVFEFLANEPTPSHGDTIEPGEYATDAPLRIASGTTIDTGEEGDEVHVAVDDDLSISGIDIEGEGRAHFYASGNVDVRDVTVPDERAEHLWVYGSEDSSVSLSNTVQGVYYAPEADVDLADGAEVFGAVVGGNTNVGEDVEVHFDKALRTDVPIPDEDQRQEFVIVAENEVDISFVLDRSGSMRQNDPNNIIKPATQNALNLLDGEFQRAGAYEFNHQPNTLHEMTDDIDAVNDAIEANQDGQTRIDLGMEVALDDHEANADPEREDVMILMTDGQNVPRGLGDPLTIEQAERAAADNVTVFTIAFSEQADEELMQEVADITGGDHRTVLNAADIEDVMAEFLGNVTESEDEARFEASFDAAFNPPSDDSVLDITTYRVELES